jgi:hypothetical protein
MRRAFPISKVNCRNLLMAAASVAALAALSSASARADCSDGTATWKSNTNGNWSNSADWSNGSSPNDANMCVDINQGSSTVTLNSSGTTSVDDLLLGSSNTLNVSVNSNSPTLDLYGNLTDSGAITVGGGTNSNQTNFVTMNFLGSASELTIGGTLTLDNYSVLNMNDSGSEISNRGTLSLTGNSTLNMYGTIDNNTGGILSLAGSSALNMYGTTIDNVGTIEISSRGSGGFWIDNNVTLSGGGQLELSGSGLLRGAASTDSLTNVDNTISGSGSIGGHMFDFTNENTVDANVKGGTLSLGDITTVTNTGLMEATNGGILTISLGSGFNFDNSGGTIKADGTTNGATVNIDNVTINGGTLETVNGGVMQTIAGTETTLLNGVTIASGSTYLTAAGTSQTTTELEGTIVNQGAIKVEANGNESELSLDGNVTLSGGGNVELSTTGAGIALIGMASGSGTLTNLNNDIEGAGYIDSGSEMTLLNEGTVDANTSGQALYVSAGTVTNNGIFEADSGATLDIENSLKNYSSSTHVLTGGTYNAESGIIQLGPLGSSGGEITTNDANIFLSGSTGEIEDKAGLNALSALATNESGASFATGSGQEFTTTANFGNSGTVTIGGGSSFSDTHTSSTFNNQSGGELQGTGTVVVNTLFNYGTVTPGSSAGSAGTLSITGNFTQESTGTLQIEIGGTSAGQYGQLDISGTANLAGTLAVNLINGFTLAMGDKFNILNAGTDPGDFGSFTFDGLGCTSGLGDTWHCAGMGSLYFQEVFLPGGQQMDLDVVPEPGSLMLFGSGLVAAGWFALRRKKPV